MEIYRKLYDRFGPQHWWPAQTRTEMIVGAVLTQNTAWRNVESALSILRSRNLLALDALRTISEKELATLIRVSGFFNVKAHRLKNLIQFIQNTYAGNLDSMFAQKQETLREQLLGVSGIGAETADSILLYAGQIPSFVVDAYTRRIFFRHGLVTPSDDYSAIQHLFMRHLPRQAPLFNEYHALIVRTAKVYCKREPQCGACPLGYLMPPTGDPFVASSRRSA